MRVLITGASGFAGVHLARACASAGDEVIGCSRSGTPVAGSSVSLAVNLRDADALHRIVRATRPELIYHLAALSSVGRSWEEPAQTLAANTAIAVNVLEAVRQHLPSARLVWVSSAEVYGAPELLPVDERAPLAPANPYAISKAAADMLAALYADAYELDVIRVRPFNHAGPGQLPIFIVSSLAQQAAEARLAGAGSIRVLTGNPDTRRDFTDVRDIVRAYRMLAERAPAGVYNVCSGRSTSAAEHVKRLGELVAPLRVEHVIDPDRVRAHEVMDLYGTHERLSAVTGWQPEIPLRQTMADTITWWEQEVAGVARPAP